MNCEELLRRSKVIVIGSISGKVDVVSEVWSIFDRSCSALIESLTLPSLSQKSAELWKKDCDLTSLSVERESNAYYVN